MIEEIKINGWDNKFIKYGKVKYPQSLDKNTPQNYFYQWKNCPYFKAFEDVREKENI